MRTKVFYSLFIAAAFASCTQEVIEAPVNNVQDLSIRPTLGEVVLSEGEGLDSRLAVGTGVRPVFETGDKMGAAIMDAPLYPANPYNEKNPSSNYFIVEYYSSNAGFLKDGNAWFMNSDQPLVEGNYLFYAPYNENLVLRTPFEVRVPQRQNISSEKSALSEYFADKNNVVVIGQKFLASENGVAQRPSVEYYDVMSYPKFTIVNNFDGYLSQFEYNEDGERTGNCNLVDYTGAIKLDSIQLVSKATDPVVIGGLLSNAKVASALKSTKVYPETNANAAAWTWKNPLNNHLSQLLNSSATITTESLITTFVAGGLEIAKGEEVSFFAVMPAEKFAKDKLQANVYATIDGKPYLFTVADIKLVVANPEEVLLDEEEEYKAALNAPATKDGWMFKKNSLTFLQGQAYPQEELNYDGTTLTAKSVKGSLLTIKLEGGKYDEEDTATPVQTLQVAQEVTVDGDDTEDEVITDKIDNNEEFIQFFMDTYSNAVMSEGTKVDVAEGEFAFSTNTTATINSQLIDALSTYQHDGSITIKKALSIDNDVKVAAIDAANGNVTFVSATGKTYTITLGTGYDVNANYVLSGENKSLHVKGTYSIASAAVYGNIRNNGTLSVSAKLTVNSLVNDNILNAETGANIVKPFVNNAGKTVNVNGDNAVMTINNNGIVAATDKTVSLTNVKVTGGEGRYVYTAGSDVYTAIKNAEKIAWVNAFKYAGTVDFVTAYADGSDNKTILENIKDIKKMYINDVNFATIGTIDMKNIELYITNTSLETIEGLDVTQTIVNNLKLNNRTGNQIVLNNIAANGTLVAGELYADGYNATWNGDAYGVIALVQDGLEWTVNTEAGLVKLANLVNGGASTVGVTVTLAKDMDLKNAAFTPIGNPNGPSDYTPVFNGTFDGNGKTIKNLNIKETAGCYTGLFGLIGNGAVIKNLKIDGAYVEGKHCVGTIVGQVWDDSHVENCEVVNATVVCTREDASFNGIDDYANDGDKAGVIVGLLGTKTAGDKCTLKKSKASDSTVSAGRDAGQLVGAAWAEKVTECTASNVKVSANGTSTGANINDEIIGRKF